MQGGYIWSELTDFLKYYFILVGDSVCSVSVLLKLDS